MGSYFSSTIGDTMKKNQEAMVKSQQLMLERQIQMQNLMREKQMAMQIAQARELFNWWASFYAIAGTAMIAGYKRTCKPQFLGPLLPLTFVVGYQFDFAYCNKLERIKKQADNVLENELGRLDIPGGVPTMAEIDKRRG